MLLRKMLRDMSQHKAQFVSVFLMSFLGVFIYAGIGGEWQGLRHNVDEYYNNTNLSDIWLYGNDFTSQDEYKIQAMKGITATERRLVIPTVLEGKNNPSIALHFVEKNEISKMYLASGEEFAKDKDGVWLDERFTKARGLKIGDSVILKYNDMPIKEVIKGTILSPEYVYLSDGEGMTPDFSQNGYAYISINQFPLKDKFVFNQMLLKANANDLTELEDKVHNELDGKYSVFLTRNNQESIAMFNQEIAQHKSMGEIFPVAFIAIALLTMLTTMTRIVNNQRIQIGTLKALGFNKKKIMLHYISYGFWLSLLGGTLGALIGPLTLPKLFYPSMSGFYTLPHWNVSYHISFYAIALMTVILSILVTYIASRNVLKDTPTQSLRPKAPRVLNHGILERTAIWRILGFNTKWNLRDITRNKVRSLMTVIGVLGCTALIVCALGMNDDMKDLKEWQYEDINQFASKLTLDEAVSKAQVAGIVKRTAGEALMESAIEIKANGKKKTGTVTVTDNVTLMKNTNQNRDFIDLPQKGVSISYKMANQLGVKKGDKVAWHLFSDERWKTAEISEIYRSPTSQGLTLSKEKFEETGFTFIPTSIITPTKITDKLDGVLSIMNTKDLTDGWDEMTKAMMTMVYVLIGAAAILAIVVLYNLGILSFTEMERELATLKVMGLKTKKLRNLLLTQNLWLSGIGFILGIPCGKLLVDFMISTMGDSFDMTNEIHILNLLLSCFIVLLLSILVNLMFSNKLKRIDMVSALKGVE
jgi:putative ABC transport system permease protein